MDENQWAISSDGEQYGHCSFPTKEAAINEGVAFYRGEPFYVGRCVSPPSPAQYWCAAEWLDNVNCQEEYSGEWAEGWDGDIRHPQITELETEVRAVMQAWLARHNLLPKFFNIEDSEHIEPVDNSQNKLEKFVESLPDPNLVGATEYRLVHELVSDYTTTLDEAFSACGELVEHALSMQTRLEKAMEEEDA